MPGASSTTKGGGISATRQHKGTSEEPLNRAEMKGFGRAESLLQWDIKRQQTEQNTTCVNEKVHILVAQPKSFRGLYLTEL